MYSPRIAVLAVIVFAAVAATRAPRALAPVVYTAQMSAAKETPPTTEKGTGTGTFTLDGTTVAYSVSVTGLTGPATGAHIHVGAPGVAGGVVYPFTAKAVASGVVASGTIDLSKPVSATVSADSLKKLFDSGNAYVNVHTAAHAGGEIRGQLMKK